MKLGNEKGGCAVMDVHLSYLHKEGQHLALFWMMCVFLIIFETLRLFTRIHITLSIQGAL